MNFYEHTIIARQDTSPSQLKQIQEKYTGLVKKNEVNQRNLVIFITPTLIEEYDREDNFTEESFLWQ